MTRVSFPELAERELYDAASYYENETNGLGERFLNDIEGLISSIIKNPKAGKRVRGKVRQRILRRFPYGILYSVRVEGIRNLRRRPMYWVDRAWESWMFYCKRHEQRHQRAPVVNRESPIMIYLMIHD